MQMLPRTASDPNVGINDITSAANNIHAAVKYLAFLRDRYFSGPQLTPPDRLAFVWAAYNAGPARVAQMRERAKQQGLDPDRWFENVEYAALELVGQGPVRYVANIYKYYVAYRLMEDMLFAGSTAGPPG
jgi:membrane-bound lytic murein transglycosylase MltF